MADEEYDDDFSRESVYSLAPEDILFQAQCMFPFESTCDVELPLNEGDVVNVTRTDVGGGWWEGELDGNHGLFPESYVQQVGEGEDASAGTGGDAEQAEQACDDTTGEAAPTGASTRPAHKPGGGAPSSSSAPPGAPFISEGNRWHYSEEPLTITVTKSDVKGSKFSGIKQFTVYEITSSSGSRKVTRRFKHFAWLHERLARMFPCINIPAIPEKQVQGRFGEGFIEYRRQKLERFLNRVSRHPVLGSSSVFRHFLTATDQKEWKTGKRQAEAESSESKFLASIVCAEALPGDHEDSITKYTQFANWFEKSLHSLESEYEALLKVHKATTEGLEKVSTTLKCFGDPTLFAESERPPFKPWWEQDDPMMHLLNSLGIVGEGVKQLSILSSEQEAEERRGILGFIKEYTSLLKAFHPVFKAHHSAWHEFQQLSSKESVPAETLASVQRNCETITTVVLAEARHFYENASYDLCVAMREHIQAKAAFHRKAAQLWDQLLAEFPEPQ